jgi:hypothetical protein
VRWTEHVACRGEKMNAYRDLVQNPEGKIPVEKPRHRSRIILN